MSFIFVPCHHVYSCHESIGFNLKTGIIEVMYRSISINIIPPCFENPLARYTNTILGHNNMTRLYIEEKGLISYLTSKISDDKNNIEIHLLY